jgi:hypothetical protein
MELDLSRFPPGVNPHRQRDDLSDCSPESPAFRVPFLSSPQKRSLTPFLAFLRLPAQLRFECLDIVLRQGLVERFFDLFRRLELADFESLQESPDFLSKSRGTVRRLGVYRGISDVRSAPDAVHVAPLIECCTPPSLSLRKPEPIARYTMATQCLPALRRTSLSQSAAE